MIEKEKRKGERMEYKNCEECNKEIPLLQLGELCGVVVYRKPCSNETGKFRNPVARL